MRRFTSLALSLAAYLLAGALPARPDSLSGKVLDPQGKVVPNADLTLFDRSSGNMRKTTSSAAGEYRFEDIAPGTYLMEVQASGAALTASEDIAVGGTSNKDVTLGVARSSVRVLVSATSTPITEQEVARVVDVVDAQQINERNEVYIAEVLRTVPGVQIQTQVGGVFQIRTRGLPNQYTAVLIDGLRFRDAVAPQGDASGFLSDMNVTDLSRAEFLRGSGSSLYGTNAIAGAVSLDSNEGGGQAHGSIRAEGGGLGFFRGTANLAGGVANNRFVYSGGASHLNVTSGVRGATPNRNTSGEFFGKYFFGNGLSLSGRVWGSPWVFQRAVDSPAFTPAILANFPAAPAIVKAIPLDDSQMALYETKRPFSAGNATFIPGVPDPDGNRISSFGATAFILRHEITPRTSWRASYQLVNTKRAFYDGPAGAGSFEPAVSQLSNFDGRTQQLQLRFDTRSARYNLFTGGYEFENEYIDSLANRNLIGGSLIRTTGKQNSHSFYGQDQVRLLEGRLQIVFGGRFQKFDLKQPTFTGATSPYERTPVSSPGNAYTGDVSIAYFVPTSGTKFRGHVGNGYRAPSLYERFGSGYSSFSSSFTYYGDPRLSSETSLSFDGGIDQWLFNNKVRASATFFYTDLDETIIFNSANFPAATDPFGRFFGYTNSPGGGIARGIELSTQMSPTSKTSVTMSYTYNNADTRFPSIGPSFFRALRTAGHIYSLTATQWITRRFNLTGDFYALGDTFESPFGAGSRIMQFPSPKRTDLVANYSIPVGEKRAVNVYVKLENMFNLRYTDNGYLAPQLWAIAGLKYNF